MLLRILIAKSLKHSYLHYKNMAFYFFAQGRKDYTYTNTQAHICHQTQEINILAYNFCLLTQ